MKVLVTYATHHGATQGIADRIAQFLGARGLEVTVRAVDAADDVADYDAYVIGSASYMFHWLKEATGFVRKNLTLLAARPVWIFSSGPLGTDKVDARGRDALTSAEPKEWPNLRAALHPRGERVFFGAYDPNASPVGVGERLVRLMPAARDAMPAGDFRDWPAIDAWADAIAAELGAPA